MGELGDGGTGSSGALLPGLFPVPLFVPESPLDMDDDLVDPDADLPGEGAGDGNSELVLLPSPELSKVENPKSPTMSPSESVAEIPSAPLSLSFRFVKV